MVVAIHRGVKTLVAPGPDEMVFPKDDLLVLGTDDEVERARGALERPPGLAERNRSFDGFELRPFSIDDQHRWNGQTLRELRLRERSGCLVVGVERGPDRWLSPKTEHKISSGDLLWVVGPSERLDELKLS
jgi:CPA2 family monovalent cation:H+ antiporter-2